MTNRPLVTKLLCVALVAAIMIPAGDLIFPFVSDQLSGIQFQTIEAVIGATVGFGISAAVG